MLRKTCTHCGSTEHTQFYCRRKPRGVVYRNRGLRQLGKYGKQWLITRQTWFRKNQPNQAGLYECYLRISPLCPRFTLPAETTLDHVQSRSRYPELRYTLSNLKPACYPCNTLKANKNLEEVM